MRQFGPCPTCGMMFQSRMPKKYCCLSCYTSSPELVARLRENSKKANAAAQVKLGLEPKTGEDVPCLECGTLVHRKPSEIGVAKYCSRSCYRKYMAKRFDRHIANPERIALPQNYDEFLTGGLLRCLVDGCEWRGHQLSMHMNIAHGVAKTEFKMMAGFNLKTGVISQPLRDAYSEREKVGIAILDNFQGKRMSVNPREVNKYRSREAAEHHIKGRMVAIATKPVQIIACSECGKETMQLTPFGKKLFCSAECRSAAYKRTKRANRQRMTCSVCGMPFDGSYDQQRRLERGGDVVCSMECRQRRNGRMARKTWIDQGCAK
jgi:hypothetical protein